MVDNPQARYSWVKAPVDLANRRLKQAGIPIDFSFSIDGDEVTLFKTETFAGSTTCIEFCKGELGECLKEMQNLIFDEFLNLIDVLRFSLEVAGVPE